MNGYDKAKLMKVAVMCYLRYKRRYKIIATEAGYFSADVLAMNDKELLEVEIKISKSDFKNDFKKSKHLIYNNDEAAFSEIEKSFIPNRMYYAVPCELVEWAKEQLTTHPQYGLISVDLEHHLIKSSPECTVNKVKLPKKFHKSLPSDKVRASIIARNSSELCTLYKKMINAND